jgi:hypothetical protein
MQGRVRQGSTAPRERRRSRLPPCDQCARASTPERRRGSPGRYLAEPLPRTGGQVPTAYLARDRRLVDPLTGRPEPVMALASPLHAGGLLGAQETLVFGRGSPPRQLFSYCRELRWVFASLPLAGALRERGSYRVTLGRYDGAHQALRKRLALEVNAGLARCVRCGELIAAGKPWDLVHVDGTERKVYSDPNTAAATAPPLRTERGDGRRSGSALS